MLHIVSPPLDPPGAPAPDRTAPVKSPRPVPSNRPPPRLTVVRPVNDCECLSIVGRLLIWATRNTPAARKQR
jgi:hypothetical protein